MRRLLSDLEALGEDEHGVPRKAVVFSSHKVHGVCIVHGMCIVRWHVHGMCPLRCMRSVCVLVCMRHACWLYIELIHTRRSTPDFDVTPYRSHEKNAPP